MTTHIHFVDSQHLRSHVVASLSLSFGIIKFIFAEADIRARFNLTDRLGIEHDLCLGIKKRHILSFVNIRFGRTIDVILSLSVDLTLVSQSSSAMFLMI